MRSMADTSTRAMSLNLAVEHAPHADTIRAFKHGVDAYNFAAVGPDEYTPLWIIARDAAGHLQAGLHAQSYWRWMYVDWLWVAQEYRKYGIGSRLLKHAEEVASERDCVGVFVSSYTFQAPQFYVRHGYKEFGRLQDLPPGHARIWFSKPLGAKKRA